MKPADRIIQIQKMVTVARRAPEKIQHSGRNKAGIATEALENMGVIEMGKTHAILHEATVW